MYGSEISFLEPSFSSAEFSKKSSIFSSLYLNNDNLVKNASHADFDVAGILIEIIPL